MMPNIAPFEGIKRLFPNIGIQTVGEEFKVFIPMSDIVNTLTSSIREDIRRFVIVKPMPDGILIKIDVANSIMKQLKSVAPNVRFNTSELELFISREDIIAQITGGNPNLKAEYTEKGVTIYTKMM